jgi:hypothetical protein
MLLTRGDDEIFRLLRKRPANPLFPHPNRYAIKVSPTSSGGTFHDSIPSM